jgi:ribose-phosphate pyrophosphokinase
MNHYHGELCIISCTSGRYFAKSIVKALNLNKKKKIEILDSEEVIFANTELKTVLNESVRGRDVFVVQDIENHYDGRSVDENLRALYTVIGACRRCDANYITAVLPSYPYARQEKQWGREDITAARVAWELEGDLGADHIISIDLHNPAIQGFFRSAQIENLRGSYVLVPHIKSKIRKRSDTVVTSTDLGGAKRANYYAHSLNCFVAFTFKTRDYHKANTVENMELLGDIENKDIYIVDDMIDTAGTFCKACTLAKSKGAKKIVGVTTFALLNNDALSKLQELHKEKILNKLICTDASYIPVDILRENSWIEVVSVAPYFAEIIRRLHNRASIGELLK